MSDAINYVPLLDKSNKNFKCKINEVSVTRNLKNFFYETKRMYTV